jgi:hypothetical protein
MRFSTCFSSQLGKPGLSAAAIGVRNSQSTNESMGGDRTGLWNPGEQGTDER